MRFSVQHRTRYVYDGKVSDSINEAYLCPINNDLQICAGFDLKVVPDGASVLRRIDFFSNQVYHFELLEPHDHLEVTARSEVETFTDTRDFSVSCDPGDLAELDRYAAFYDFLCASKRVQLVPMMIHESRDVVGEMEDVQEAVNQIMSFVHGEFSYKTGVTNAKTGAVEAFSLRSGVCQDYAHVMIALCRALKIPARYVSGYFFTESMNPSPLDDNTQSHAWVECFLPGIGWVEYDPTHNRRVGDRYIRAAIGRDYSDVRPLSGTFRGQRRVKMDVEVTVWKVD